MTHNRLPQKGSLFFLILKHWQCKSVFVYLRNRTYLYYTHMKEVNVPIHIVAYEYEELSEEDRQLIDTAKAATNHSYAPYSRFSVGYLNITQLN